MILGFLVHTVAGMAGLWLSTRLIPAVDISGSWLIFLFAGLIWGFINVIIKPIRLIFWGIVNFLLSILTVWIIDILFPQIVIPGIVPLILTTAVVAIIDGILILIFKT